MSPMISWLRNLTPLTTLPSRTSKQGIMRRANIIALIKLNYTNYILSTILNIVVRNKSVSRLNIYCHTANASASVNLPSNKARPKITPSTWVGLRRSMSANEPMPPDACHITLGKAAFISAYNSALAP